MRKAHPLVGSLIVGAVLLNSACSTSDTASSSSGPGNVDSSVQAAVEAAYKGNAGKVPASGPEIATGKTVWVISCTQLASGCSEPAAGFKEAGTKVGWKVTVFDGKGSPATQAQGIHQAIAAGAHGIFLSPGINCPDIRQALEDASSAGVKVVDFSGADCSDPAFGGPSLFDAAVNLHGFPDWKSSITAWAKVKANVVIARTNGQARIIELQQDEQANLKYLREAFDEELASKCPDCKVVEKVPFALTDLGPALQAKVVTALQRHPEANSIHGLYDAAVQLGVAPAVVQAGRVDKTFVMGGEGFAPNITLIRENKGQNAALCIPSRYAGWAGVDQMNRLFAGQKGVDQGLGWQLVDAEHNLPPKGESCDLSGYRAAYQKLWNVR